MTDENTQPKPADPGEPGAAPSGGGEEANPSSDKPNGTEAVLSFLKENTGREHVSIEDATKSIKELNSLVGDRAIAELRKKGDAADVFEKVVLGYAKDNSLSAETARTDLLGLIEEAQGKEGGGNDGKANPELETKVSDLEARLDLADLLNAKPESKHVLDELKDIAKGKGISLQDAYAGSKVLQEAAESKAASTTEEGGQPSTVTPSGRLSATEHGKALEAAQVAYGENRTEDNADALVAAALGIKKD